MSGFSPQFDFNLKSENRNPGVIIIILRIKFYTVEDGGNIRENFS